MEAIYKIYDLRKYYPDFVGANPIAVVSDLTEEELMVHCPELQAKAPFVYFEKEKWSAFRSAQHQYNRNEEKNKKRKQYLEDRYGYQEGRSELHASGLENEDIMDAVLTKISVEHLREVMRTMPEAQARRILLFYSGYTFKEIAEQEKVSYQAIQWSIKRAMRYILKNF